MKFLLDANFLMIPAQFKVDIFSELVIFGKPELYTLDLVVNELEKLARETGNDARHARLALTMAKEKGVEILPARGNTDKAIERVAAEQNMVVCTQDRELISRLKVEDVKVVSLKQKRYLAMV